jgi:type IV secretion system protein VirB10
MTIEPQAPAFGEGPPPIASWKKMLIVLAILGGLSLLIVAANWLSSRTPAVAKFNTDTGGITQDFARPTPPAPPPVPQRQPGQMFQASLPANPVSKEEVNIDASSYGGGDGGGGYSGAGRGAGAAGGAQDGVDDELAHRLQESHVGGAGVAYAMAHPELTIPPGVKIPCEMQTAIDSQLPGFISCLTQAPGMSADGHVELMPRGTWVFGEVQHGLTEGQDRLFLLWTLARTPQNVMVPLDSPGTDKLGQSGIGGEVQNHWLRRFGLAFAASIIEAGPQLATAALQNNGNNAAISNYTQVFQQPGQLANTILSKEINIPPTLTVHQGALVMIFIARPLYFGNVYDLKAVSQ